MRNSNLSHIEKKLGNCCVKVGSGITPKGGDKAYLKKGIPFIRSQNVYPDGLRLDDIVYISTEQHQKMVSTQLKPFDVLLNITGASIGRCCVVPQNLSDGNVNQHVCIIRCNDSLNPFYLSYFLNSSIGQKQINSFQAGGNRQGLNYEQIKRFNIPHFPIKEQKKIAKILSTWDRSIETIGKLIDAKTRLKKGLMQKMLIGKIRYKEFKEHWADYEYDDLFETISPKKNQVAKEKYKEIGKYPIVDQGQSRIVGYTDEDKVFQNVPIIVFGDHTRIIKWVDFPFVVGADGTQLLKTKSICDLKYGFYALSNLRLPSLGYSRHFKVVKESTFYVPSNPKEQTKITETLSSVDHELDLLSSILNMLKIQKKGLMQKLLTGKVRVKI